MQGICHILSEILVNQLFCNNLEFDLLIRVETIKIAMALNYVAT